MISSSSVDVLSLFAQGITPFVEVLLNEAKMGICRGKLRISDLNTGNTASEKPALMDRFKVVLPYAGCSITWHVIFNAEYPESPPDFLFGQDDDDFSPEIDKLKALSNWNADNTHGLVNILEELIEQYKHHHLQVLSSSSRLQFEYSSLLDQSFSPADIEIFTSKRGTKRYGPVNFLLKLPVDFSRIPAYLTKHNPGEDAALLLVIFQSSEGTKVSPQLYLSPRVERILGDASTARIPPFPGGSLLIDYIPLVSQLLENKINHVVHGYEKRRDYVSALLSQFGRCIIEYNSQDFTNVSFLFEWHDFFFNLLIELPLGFPGERPTYTFQSVYHEDEKGTPYTKVVKEFPYSPRWNATEMVNRIRTFIISYIVEFQRGSVSEGSLRQ